MNFAAKSAISHALLINRTKESLKKDYVNWYVCVTDDSMSARSLFIHLSLLSLVGSMCRFFFGIPFIKNNLAFVQKI